MYMRDIGHRMKFRMCGDPTGNGGIGKVNWFGVPFWLLY